MVEATRSLGAGDEAEAAPTVRPHPDFAFDLLRGVAQYTGDPLIAALARAIGHHPEAEFDVAFNHKQVACKMWARDRLYPAFGGDYGEIWLVGGWYGVLAAILFKDERYRIGRITSFDLDPAVGPVALSLNRAEAEEGRFCVRHADMYELDYRDALPDLVINTSCEHIPDLSGWLGLLPSGCPVLLQSNNYAAEPSHVSCVANMEEFASRAGLSQVLFQGALPLKNYIRFMLIGRT
jgi:hypothetical protein